MHGVVFSWRAHSSQPTQFKYCLCTKLFSTKINTYGPIIILRLDFKGRTKTELTVEMSVLRKGSSDRRRNVDRSILKELNVRMILLMYVKIRRLTYFNHVTRTKSNRLPHILLYGYTHGHRHRGRPKKNGWIIFARLQCAQVRLWIWRRIKLLAVPWTGYY